MTYYSTSGYDDENTVDADQDDEQPRRALVSYHRPSGLLSDRAVLGIVALTIAMILCSVASWRLWTPISSTFIAFTNAISALFSGFGTVAPLIGFTLGLAAAATPLVIVAWLGGHAYVSLKGRFIRSHTFQVNPEVNNYGAFLDTRLGRFVQPIAGELPQRVPTVPQTYSPHITYKGGEPPDYYEEEEDEEQGESEMEQLPPARFTVEELARTVERNSMVVPIGRSLSTREMIWLEVEGSGNVLVLGMTQKGKSSWIASHLDILTRTHDRQHILLAILDLENKTGKLFETVPHIVRAKSRGRDIALHARDIHQVATCLLLLHDEMDRRYTLPEQQQAIQPFIMIYFEEFLSFRRSSKLDKQVRARAFDAFSELAKRGLKVRMKLLASAQLNYAADEDDVREAMGQFDTYIGFCLKPDAARAAGMIDNALIKANYASKQPGQFVVESAICTDMGLSPDYPLKQKLLEYEAAKQIAAAPFRDGDDMSITMPPKPLRNEDGNEQRNDSEAAPEANLNSKVKAVMEIPGESMKECILRVWGVKPGDSEAYRTARAEYAQCQQIIHAMARRAMDRAMDAPQAEEQEA